jgi:hypothetical protein
VRRPGGEPPQPSRDAHVCSSVGLRMLCGVPERRAAFLFRIVGGRLERAPPGQWVSRPPGVVARSRDRRRTRLPNDRRRTQEVLALCRQGATIQRGDPRRMASCRWAVGLSWTPMARLVWDGLVFAGNRPGALAPRPRRRVFGVERQASQSGGDNQAAASASPAPSQELDVRLTGTNPSADRKRGPESRLVTQGAPAHLKVRPPRAPRGQDVFLEWGAPASFLVVQDWTSGPRGPDQREARSTGARCGDRRGNPP